MECTDLAHRRTLAPLTVNTSSIPALTEETKRSADPARSAHVFWFSFSLWRRVRGKERTEDVNESCWVHPLQMEQTHKQQKKTEWELLTLTSLTQASSVGGPTIGSCILMRMGMHSDITLQSPKMDKEEEK